MKKIFSMFFLLSYSIVFTQTNPGFETGDLTSWEKETDATGTLSISTSNVRTGTYNLSYATNTSTYYSVGNSDGITVPNGQRIHLIAWAVGSNSSANARLTIVTTTTLSSSSVNMGTTPTRLYYNRPNSTGSEITAYVALNSSRNVGGGNTTIYWDDIVVYISSSSTTDLTDPNSASTVIVSSNSSGDQIIVTWTDGTDAETGSQQALILRADGLSQTPPELNDQGRYSVNGGSNGPNTIGSWTVVGIVDAGIQTFTDVTTTPNSEYTYAVYMRDMGYNYSSGASSDITALPVQLSCFNASVINNEVHLNWETATEINNYGFDIERTVVCNGYGVLNDWQKIGFVKGNGNSSSPKFYSFEDKPFGGKEFKYRLKQIDFDGKFEYSNVVFVSLDSSISNFELCQNYPNPFNPKTKIIYTIPRGTNVKITVYDMIGREITTLIDKYHERGTYQVEFNGSTLCSGMYCYKLNAGIFSDVKKFILIK